MAIYNTTALLAQLKNEVHTILDSVQQLRRFDNEILNYQPAPDKWSVLQVLEHLNTYNRYYLPCATIAMNKVRKPGGVATFRAGWLGEYFTKSMYSEVVTNKQVTNKMKALKGHRPATVLNADAVINEFLTDGKKLQQLLEDAVNADLAGVKIPITISKWIKISLGDALRFLIAHQVRHMLQIANTLDWAMATSAGKATAA